ncbi:SH2 domain-containing protein 6 [Pseudophryne corroboree]|uniref:SH2 domain-containing protein 6 n=1 Tax=Pseudophryne corroboree TaxID=495146 RepID=UPI003081A609
MYGSNRRQSCLPPDPPCQYENHDPEDDEEDDDLYEPPPCDLQSRSTPYVWTPQDNHSFYLGRPTSGPIIQKPPIAGRAEQSHRQQRPPELPISRDFLSAPKHPRTIPSSKPALPLPLPDRRVSLPCTAIRSPPICSSKFPRGMDDLYLTLLDTQARSDNDTASGSRGNSSSQSVDMELMGKSWYGGEMERKEAERTLSKINKDGCFLVRVSIAHSNQQPYTLVVLYNGHIFNIPIRAVGNRGFSLGKEGKRNEEVFPSVVQLIEHFQREQLYLVNRQTLERESTALLYPALM